MSLSSANTVRRLPFLKRQFVTFALIATMTRYNDVRRPISSISTGRDNVIDMIMFSAWIGTPEAASVLTIILMLYIFFCELSFSRATFMLPVLYCVSPLLSLAVFSFGAAIYLWISSPSLVVLLQENIFVGKIVFSFSSNKPIGMFDSILPLICLHQFWILCISLLCSSSDAYLATRKTLVKILSGCRKQFVAFYAILKQGKLAFHSVFTSHSLPEELSASGGKNHRSGATLADIFIISQKEDCYA